MLKLGFRLSVGIHNRVFVIPWVKRHSVSPRILCSEKRDYSSSGLGRYVPKKYRKMSRYSIEKTLYGSGLDLFVLRSGTKGNSKEAREGTFLDLQERNDAGSYMNGSFNDSNEGIMSFYKGNFREAGESTSSHLQDKNDTGGVYKNVSCDDSTQELEESSDGIRSRGYKWKRQHKKNYDEIKLYLEAEPGKEEAENMAIRYLGVRAYTAAELKKKLIGKKYPLEIVERVINDYHHRGFINDNFYAEAFSQFKWSSLSWGPKRIKQALFKKGISNLDSEAAIKLVFQKGQYQEEDDEEEEPRHELSKEELDLLYVLASNRWLKGRDLPIENRKARVIRWFQYQGFNSGLVSQLLKRLESHQSS